MATETHSPQIDTTESYEVWVRDLATGALRRTKQYSFPDKKYALRIAETYNAEEVENARMEMNRPLRREFVVIRATTTYDIIDG